MKYYLIMIKKVINKPHTKFGVEKKKCRYQEQTFLTKIQIRATFQCCFLSLCFAVLFFYGVNYHYYYWCLKQ